MFAESEPNDVRLKTASGEIVNGYGAGVIYGKDATGMMRRLNGEIADVHKVLVSAAKMHEKGFCIWLGPGGGEIIPLNHPVNDELGKAYARAVRQHGKEGIVPVTEENGIYNFYIREEELRSGVSRPATPEREPPNHDQLWSVPEGARPAGAGSSSRSRSRHRPVCALEDDVVVLGDDDIAAEPMVDDQVEARPARPGWSPTTPTDEERREHESSGHAVFRSWCEQCLQATGYAQKHTKKDHSGETIPTVSLDYFFLSEEQNARPHLVAIDRKTGMMMATSLEKKGVGDVTGRKLLTRFLELLGHKEVILKSDGEHAIVKLKKEAGRDATTVTRVICEESPAGDAKANGEAEAAVREIKWRIRAVHLTLEKKLGIKLDDGHPLVQWIPRYSAEQANRFRVGADGKTLEDRKTGKRWVKPLPLFGEKILIKPAGKGKKSDLARMKPARFVGCHNRFGSVLGMTTEGVIVGSGFHRLADDEQWVSLEDGLRGAPWDVRAYVKRLQPEAQQQAVAPPAPLVVVQPGGQVPAQADLPGQDGEAEQLHEDTPVGDVGGPSASGQRPLASKAWPVKREHLQKFGSTVGCPGCTSLARGIGFQQIAHNNECRNRIKRRLEDEVKLRDLETKRLREDDQSGEAVRDEAPPQQPAQQVGVGREVQSGPSSSSRPDVIVQDDQMLEQPREELEESSPSKRKGGEHGVTDVDDLFREAETEEAANGPSPAQQQLSGWRN